MARRAPRTCSIAEARDRFTEIVHEAEAGQRVHITRRGTPVAVLVSVAEWEGRARASFYPRLQRLREEHADDLHELAQRIDEARDRGPGRDVEL